MEGWRMEIPPRRLLNGPSGNACGPGVEIDRPLALVSRFWVLMAALGCLLPIVMMILGAVVGAAVGGYHAGIVGLIAGLAVGIVGGIALFWGLARAEEG
jgi:hypothetical protein